MNGVGADEQEIEVNFDHILSSRKRGSKLPIPVQYAHWSIYLACQWYECVCRLVGVGVKISRDPDNVIIKRHTELPARKCSLCKEVTKKELILTSGHILLLSTSKSFRRRWPMVLINFNSSKEDPDRSFETLWFPFIFDSFSSGYLKTSLWSHF